MGLMGITKIRNVKKDLGLVTVTGLWVRDILCFYTFHSSPQNPQRDLKSILFPLSLSKPQMECSSHGSSAGLEHLLVNGATESKIPVHVPLKRSANSSVLTEPQSIRLGSSSKTFTLSEGLT